MGLEPTVAAQDREPIDDLLAAVHRDTRDQISRVLEERFAAFEKALRPEFARERLEIVRGLAQHLNDCFSRMRTYESDRAWCDAILDAAAGLSQRSAFFSIRGNRLCLQGARGMSFDGHGVPPEIDLSTAPAFMDVAKSPHVVETTRTVSRLSAPIAQFVGETPLEKSYLIPLVLEDRVAGVLYAEDPVEIGMLETITSFGAACLELNLHNRDFARPHPVLTPQPQFSAFQQQRTPPPAKASQPVEGAREQHFARVVVAQMLLENVGTVSRGRTAGNLYEALQGPIDQARSSYQSQFPSSRDFLHEELVTTLAQGDPMKLGAAYPGQL